jgi:hypothetical protein
VLAFLALAAVAKISSDGLLSLFQFCYRKDSETAALRAACRVIP